MVVGVDVGGGLSVVVVVAVAVVIVTVDVVDELVVVVLVVVSNVQSVNLRASLAATAAFSCSGARGQAPALSTGTPEGPNAQVTLPSSPVAAVMAVFSAAAVTLHASIPKTSNRCTPAWSGMSVQYMFVSLAAPHWPASWLRNAACSPHGWCPVTAIKSDVNPLMDTHSNRGTCGVVVGVEVTEVVPVVDVVGVVVVVGVEVGEVDVVGVVVGVVSAHSRNSPCTYSSSALFNRSLSAAHVSASLPRRNCGEMKQRMPRGALWSSCPGRVAARSTASMEATVSSHPASATNAVVESDNAWHVTATVLLVPHAASISFRYCACRSHPPLSTVNSRNDPTCLHWMCDWNGVVVKVVVVVGVVDVGVVVGVVAVVVAVVDVVGVVVRVVVVAVVVVVGVVVVDVSVVVGVVVVVSLVVGVDVVVVGVVVAVVDAGVVVCVVNSQLSVRCWRYVPITWLMAFAAAKHLSRCSAE